jgi:ATP-binding cassette subfamily B protein
MTNDVETINEIFSSGVVTLIADFIKMAAIIAMMLALDVRLTLMTFVTLPVLIVVVLYARGIMRTSFRQIRVKLAAMNSFVQEHVSGMKVVQLFGREARAASEYDQLNGDHRDAYLGAIRADASMYAVVEAIGVCSAASIAWYSGANIGDTGLTVGLVVAFIEYINKFFIPVRDLSAKYTVMQSAMAASERIVALLDTDEPDAPARSDIADDQGDDAVAFEQVHFGYRKGEPVLQGIDMNIRRGDTVAVVGATGSGKSTIIRLLTRLYEPQEGTIRLAGKDILGIPVDELRRRVTVVSQDVFLFSGTVGENVRLGRPDATDAEVEDALDRVGALRLLKRRGQGLDEKVSERGSNFSSGEKQLISFARALIRDPELLVLDEATAHVDPEVEGLIETALTALMAGRTTLVVAHRLSTIRRADQIVVLSHGKVAEAGTHDSLVEADGMYARLERTFRAR